MFQYFKTKARDVNRVENFGDLFSGQPIPTLYFLLKIKVHLSLLMKLYFSITKL